MKTISFGSIVWALSMVASVLLAHSPAGAFPIDVATGTSGHLTSPQSFNETRGVDVTVLAGDPLQVTSMTLNGFRVGGDGMAEVGARIYSSPSGTLLAANSTTVFADGSVTLPISATLVSGNSYRICFFAGPLGPNEDNSATLFDPDPPGSGGFPYTESSGSLRINQAYSIHADGYPTNMNIFVPLIVMEANSGGAGLEEPGPDTSKQRIRLAVPNPFRSTTNIQFELAQNASVEARILDLSGRTIRVLATSKTFPEGSHAIQWDGKNDSGRKVETGIYFFLLEAGTTRLMCRVGLLR